MKKDAQSMLEYGYVLLGRSKFKDEKIDEDEALDQATAIGAWVVMVSEKYIGTKTKSVPVVTWVSQDQTITEYPQVPIEAPKILAGDRDEKTPVEEGRGNSSDATGKLQRDSQQPPGVAQPVQVTTTTLQEQVTYVPEDVDYYQYAATYWAKTKPSPFGVIVQSRGGDSPKPDQVHQGVVVKAVVVKSPAYVANVLAGDVLVNLAGETIVSPDQFFDIVDRNAGKAVTLSLTRNGQAMTLPIQLGPEPSN